MKANIQFLMRVVFEGEIFFEPVQKLDAFFLLEHLLQTPDLNCCSFQGGYFLSLNEQKWNQDCDEYWMSLSWLAAFKQILQGSQEDILMPYWEESQAKISFCQPKHVRLVEYHPAIGMLCPEFTISIEDFYLNLRIATEQYLEFWKKLEPLLSHSSIPTVTRKHICNEMIPEQFQQALLEINNLWPAWETGKF